MAAGAGAADAFARPQPRLRGLDATTTLRDFALVTFAVDPGLLAKTLPAGLTPEVVVLTHPLDGYFRRRNGSLGRYAVWHERLRPQLGTARRASYAVFEDLGLVEPGAIPHSVLLQRAVDFDVLLPPTRI